MEQCIVSLEPVLNMTRILPSKLPTVFTVSLSFSLFFFFFFFFWQCQRWYAKTTFEFSSSTNYFDLVVASFFGVFAQVSRYRSLKSERYASRKSNRVASWRFAHCCPVIFANPCLLAGVLVALLAMRSRSCLLHTTFGYMREEALVSALPACVNPRSFFQSRNSRCVDIMTHMRLLTFLAWESFFSDFLFVLWGTFEIENSSRKHFEFLTNLYSSARINC